MKTIYSVCAFIVFFSCDIFAVPFEGSEDTTSAAVSRIYATTRLTTAPPKVDGVLNDACWDTGEWAGDFTQWIPTEGAKPTYPTHLKILYDDNNIYVAIRAFDGEPEKISRKAGRRDEFDGDMVGINFDSYHDHRTGFEFNVTAAGQKVDLVLINPLQFDLSWNAVWYVKTAMEDSAWTAEFQIPLSQLRYSRDDKQVWGLHCWRWIDRLQEESDWEPQSTTGPGILYQFGELHGIRGLPRSRRIEIMPYSLGRLNTFEKEAGNPFADNGRSSLANLGLNAKIGLASNFTADVAINPDFGQVEADPSVLNLTAFETFFDEKRPFFLEGKNIFDFEVDDASIFYSRRVGQAPNYTPDLQDQEYMKIPDNTTILSAAKISGKTAGGLSIGVMQSLTTNENAIINSRGVDSKLRVEPMASYLISRVQQDYGASNTVVGGIFTAANRFINDDHLNFLNANAYAGGFDLLHYWKDQEFFVDAKLLASHVRGSTDAMTGLQNSSARYYQRPDANHLRFDSTRTQLSGHGGKIKFGKGSKGLWRYSTEINWRSPGLELNDLGFMQRADIIAQRAELLYFVIKPVAIFRRYSISLEQENKWDFDFAHLSSGAGLDVHLDFLNKWAIVTSVKFTSKALDTRILRGGPAMLVPAMWEHHFNVRTDPSKKVILEAGFDHVHGNTSRRYYGAQPSISVRPVNNLKISMSLDYSVNTDHLQYTETPQANNEDKFILAKLRQRTLGATFRIDYSITPDLSIQYYGSPFASVGKYSEFKVITNPQADNYSDRFALLNPTLVGENYQVSEGAVSYSFANPDFNFHELRSNLVCRWEYRPGSQIYLVWSQDRSNFVQPGFDSVDETLRNLKDASPNNIFLLKVNYWFTL